MTRSGFLETRFSSSGVQTQTDLDSCSQSPPDHFKDSNLFLDPLNLLKSQKLL